MSHKIQITKVIYSEKLIKYFPESDCYSPGYLTVDRFSSEHSAVKFNSLEECFERYLRNYSIENIPLVEKVYDSLSKEDKVKYHL